jgi:molybdate transport system ATP-binding protein
MIQLSLHLQFTAGAFRLEIAEDLELTPITALFGPSGSGKTTLLRIIAGLERSADGRLRLGADTWQDDAAGVFLPAHARRVGYVFQDGRLFPHLNVRRNLLFSPRRGLPSSAISFDGVIAALDLGGLLERSPRSLSGGEQQRVAMGRALLTDPQLMLMDEPLSAMDAPRKAEIIPYIERLANEFRVPTLYVTHSIEEVSRLASSMILLADGRLAAFGTVSDVLERVDLWPVTGRDTAGTLVTARIESTENGMTNLDVGGQRLRIPAIAGNPGQTVRFRTLAREIAIATRNPSGLSIRNSLRAEIVNIEFVESVFAEILLQIGDQRLLAEITREAADDLELVRGQTVFALIKSVAIDRSLLG